MVWIIFQIKHLGGKGELADLRFGASNLETHSKTIWHRSIDKKGWHKVSGSALQNEHRSSVLKPILCSFELVYKIELGTLN